jgi:hypothetical protein
MNKFKLLKPLFLMVTICMSEQIMAAGVCEDQPVQVWVTTVSSTSFSLNDVDISLTTAGYSNGNEPLRNNRLSVSYEF